MTRSQLGAMLASGAWLSQVEESRCGRENRSISARADSGAALGQFGGSPGPQGQVYAYFQSFLADHDVLLSSCNRDSSVKLGDVNESELSVGSWLR